MKKVFLSRHFPSIAKQILEKKFEVEENKLLTLSKTRWKEIVTSFDGVLTCVRDHLDAEILSHAKKLKVISNFAVGLDNIDLNFAKKKKIKVMNLPDIVTESTADHTFAIFLSLIREVVPAVEYVKKGHWREWEPDAFVGEELHGKTFGIIGMGRIGQAVAQRAKGFGLKVIYHSRSFLTLPKEIADSKYVTLNELLEESDYISLHVPLTHETESLIEREVFLKMKKKPILINMSRGSVIKTEDLIHALDKKLIRGCALDVTNPEPLSKNHPLLAFPNCLITPHLGSSTKECRYKMAQKAAKNIIQVLEG